MEYEQTGLGLLFTHEMQDFCMVGFEIPLVDLRQGEAWIARPPECMLHMPARGG
jgi:hypothetical protein